MYPDLLTIEQASKQANVPQAALEKAAKTHGFLVMFGTSKRIEKDALKELYKACRVAPSQPISTTEKHAAIARPSMSSGTAYTSSQRAQDAANRLKKRSSII